MKYASTISNEELVGKALIDFDGTISVIDSVGKELDSAIEYLKKEKVLGFDTETKPCFISKAPRNKMAILQLSGADKAFIFRLQQIGLPEPLKAILENPKIVKVGVAVRDDITGLEKYKKFSPSGFKDLQEIAQTFGIEEKSVKKLSAIILGKRVSKSQQLSNWESSKLSEAQLKYAAIDAWVCREMYLKLI